MKLQKLVCTAVLGALTLGVVTQTTFAAASDIDSEGTIQFNKNTGGVDPLDPEIPGEEVEIDPEDGNNNSGKEGELRLDVVSHLKFGDDHKITTKQKDYFAAPVTITGVAAKDKRVRGNYIQLTDQRSDKAPEGWTLRAKVTSPFTNDEGEVLKGATITYNNPFVNSTQDEDNYPQAFGGVTLATQGPNGTAPGNGDFAKAEAGKGWGTYTIEYGRPSLDDKNNVVEDGSGIIKPTMGESVVLDVPANTPLRSTSAYQAVVTWTISNV